MSNNFTDIKKDELFIPLKTERGLLRNAVCKVRLIGGHWVDLENNSKHNKYVTMYYGSKYDDNEAEPLVKI